MLVAVCLLALLPVAAWGQSAELTPRLDDVTAERDRVETRVESLREREGDARTQLAAVVAELEAAEQELAASEAELERAEAALEGAQVATERARASLREVLAELEVTEQELAVATAKLEARVVAAYKYGQISFTEAFTGVRDMADFISSSTMVAHVLDGDRVMVEEFSTLHLAVEAQRAEVQVLRAEAERELVAAEAATRAIEAATSARAAALVTIEERREEREALFLALRDDREAAEGHLAGLEAESARIADQLGLGGHELGQDLLQAGPGTLGRLLRRRQRGLRPLKLGLRAREVRLGLAELRLHRSELAACVALTLPQRVDPGLDPVTLTGDVLELR